MARLPAEPLGKLEALCARHGLVCLAGLNPEPEDGAPKGCKTLLLIGPAPGFWQRFKTSPEYCDTLPDPLDRWSRRVLSEIANDVGAKALFPFGGPPYAPFFSWALKSGQCFQSPVDLLVHATHGLMVSFRGALALDVQLELPAAATHPCDGCAGKPCLGACPVNALSSTGYDVPACHGYLDSVSGSECLTAGCLVRRACPLDGAARGADQSGFHMSSFHTTQGSE